MEPSLSKFAPHSVKRPVMLQNWRHLTFLHWPYTPAEIRRRVPGGLEVDTFGGAAWVGLTPFVLEDLRAPFLPALPWVSRFPEMNLRTYVRGPEGERGIWFFTLEADRLLAVLGARLTYGLPYHWAEMRVGVKDGALDYRSVRHGRRGSFKAAQARMLLEPGDEIGSTDLELFLTARFRLYTVLAGRLAFAQVEHEPWPLRDARLLSLEENVIAESGLPEPVGKPLVHYSTGVHVRVGAPRFLSESRAAARKA
jgi:uncharacterized protein YqjF (DUF2071 family)